MINIIEILFWLFGSLSTTMLYDCLYIPESYIDRIRRLGCGIKLFWQDDKTGEITEKRFCLMDMSNRELKALEKECKSAGLKHDAEDIHDYRAFKTEERLNLRDSRKRIRNEIREALNSTGICSDNLSLKQLDEMASKLNVEPYEGIICGGRRMGFLGAK
jgi:hypothetical protein